MNRPRPSRRLAWLQTAEHIALCIAIMGFFGFLGAWHRPAHIEASQPQKPARDTAPSRTAAILPYPQKLPAKYDTHPE